MLDESQKLSKQLILSWLAFVAIVFVLYWPALNTFFLADDFNLIQGVVTKGPLGIWTFGQHQFFRPLISLSFFCDHQIWGLNAGGYHLTNIIVHLLNAMLVVYVAYLLFSAWGVLKSHKAALIAGAFFLVLPSHAEAVTWISGRTDVIAAFFALSSFVTYLIYKEHGNKKALCVSLALFIFGLTSKESIASLPLIILSYEVFQYKTCKVKSALWRSFHTSLIFIAVLTSYLILRRIMIGTFTGGYGIDLLLSSVAKNFASFVAASYFPQLPSPAYYAVALLSIFVISIIYFVWKRSTPKLLIWILIAFALSVLPVLVVAGGVHADGQSERFVYLPSAFSCIGLSLLLSLLLYREWQLNLVARLLFIVFSIQIYQSNLNWKVAGDVAQRSLVSLGTFMPARHIIALTIPDTIKGAYVYRNGFESAAALFYKGQFEQIEVVSRARFWSDTETVPTIVRQKKYSLSLPQPIAYRAHNDACGVDYYQAQGANFTATLDKDCNLQVQVQNIQSQDRIVGYSAGQLILLSR